MHIVITGASTGIGATAAKRFAKAGHKVIRSQGGFLNILLSYHRQIFKRKIELLQAIFR